MEDAKAMPRDTNVRRPSPRLCPLHARPLAPRPARCRVAPRCPLDSHDRASTLSRRAQVLSNESLYLLSHMGNKTATRERLRREIMVVDGVQYEETTAVLHEMNTKNTEGLALTKAPYQIALWTALISGWVSLPLVFHLPTALAFNDYFVTAEVADPQDLESYLEVGSWAWGWMEPPLGTISFTLLCIQYAPTGTFTRALGEL
jgi:hypothetical protein